MTADSQAIADTAAALATRVADAADRAGRTRIMVAVAGPPGAGKSTVGAALVDALNGAGLSTVLVPMDGFHLDNAVLSAHGLLARKGAPETFDVNGFLATLRRVLLEPVVYFPRFDRRQDQSIAGTIEVTPAHRVVLVEGNYLCFDAPRWRELTALWDLSVFLDVPLPVLRERLIARWLDHGLDADAAEARAMENDIPNAKAVLDHLMPVHVTLSG